MITTALFVSSTSNHMIQVFYDYANTLSPDHDGFSISLNGLHYSSVDMIKDLPFRYVYPELAEGIDGNEFSFHGHELSDYTFSANYITNQPLKVKEGIPFSKASNHSENAWISEQTANTLHCHIGDILLHTADGTHQVSYKIAGIYDNESSDDDILIPFETYYKTQTSCGKYVEHTVYGVLQDSRKYTSICQILEERNISPFSILDDSFRSLTLAHTLFQILFLLIMIAAVWTFFNLSNIIFQNRFCFIMRMHILGFQFSQISGIYILIFLSIMMLSFCLSFVLNNRFSIYVQSIVTQMFPDIHYTITSTWYQLFIGIILCIFVLYISFRRLYRKVNMPNLIGTLEGKR